jgi:anaerobic dimethyl sulfoxide reductase subunit B
MKMPEQFIFSSRRCIKCYACEIACLQWHHIPAGSFKLRKVLEVSTGQFPDVKRNFDSVTCHHCDEAPCVNVCPTGALTQRASDGVVLVEIQKCNGCRSCLTACPFGIPEFDSDGLMHKCDMCLDRIESKQKPICVETCPTQALKWGRGETG